jgi:ATP-dependent DNA helicase RecG
MDFISKHTLDKFFLIDGQSVSVRSKIARELVSNTLVHREYTSAFPAKLLIERDRITTENWNLPKHQGHLNPSNFTPYPKNPILANFFINIGRADVIGSGVRNLFKYTKIYSGGTPEFVEDDIFRTIVPLTPSTNAESEDTSKELAKNGNDTINEPLNDTINEPINPNEPINEPLNDRINDTLNPNEPIKSLANELLRILQQYPTASKEVFAQKIGKNRATVTRYLQLLREQGKIKRIGSKKTGHWEVLKP